MRLPEVRGNRRERGCDYEREAPGRPWGDGIVCIFVLVVTQINTRETMAQNTHEENVNYLILIFCYVNNYYNFIYIKHYCTIVT